MYLLVEKVYLRNDVPMVWRTYEFYCTILQSRKVVLLEGRFQGLLSMESFLGTRIAVVDDVRLCADENDDRDLKGFFLASGGISDWFSINLRKTVIARRT